MVDDELIREFLAARDEPRRLAPPSEKRRLSMDEAYALQERLRAALIGRGERIAGWKAGFTTVATQQAFGCPEPACAFLLASGVYSSGAEVPMSRFASLAAETEVAFVMREDLAGPGVTPARAAMAVQGALPAFELVDLRHSGKPVGTDIIADGVYANAIVLGHVVTPIGGLDLSLEGVVYEHNGAIAATNTAAEVMGNPLNALAWIANHLGARGLALRGGEVVMTGSVSKLVRPRAGDSIRATFTRLGSVGARFV
ncbi:MAG TPA: fumarylacetoacetate hydrolase family protein [Methylomirabilota bacterium]|nr:fumarylacetoacetate hydrolase family protein [Methylomirabilota bacterium]